MAQQKTPVHYTAYVIRITLSFKKKLCVGPMNCDSTLFVWQNDGEEREKYIRFDCAVNVTSNVLNLPMEASPVELKFEDILAEQKKFIFNGSDYPYVDSLLVMRSIQRWRRLLLILKFKNMQVVQQKFIFNYSNYSYVSSFIEFHACIRCRRIISQPQQGIRTYGQYLIMSA